MQLRSVVERSIAWVVNHPEDVLGAAKNALGLRLTVPLDVLRFLASQAKGRRAPADVIIDAAPPGLSLGATLDVMKTKLRATASVHVDEVRIGRGEFRLVVRLRDVALSVLGQSDSPVAALIRSGAVDLSKPGKLVAILPKRPLFIVEADDDRFVLDLMRDPNLARKLGKVVSLVTPLVTVSAIESTGDALAFQLSCLPNGLMSALGSLRTAR